MKDETKVIKLENENNGEFSVLVQKGKILLWVDVVVKDNDVSADWNKYIFDNTKADKKIKEFQDNLDNFENFTSTAINYLENSELIGQDNNGNWEFIKTEVVYSNIDMTKPMLKKLAKQTKHTNRLFRVIVFKENGSVYGVYLYKGKFYKSDVYNMQYVISKEKPSVTLLSDTHLHTVNEITDKEKLKEIYNI